MFDVNKTEEELADSFLLLLDSALPTLKLTPHQSHLLRAYALGMLVSYRERLLSQNLLNGSVP